MMFVTFYQQTIQTVADWKLFPFLKVFFAS